MFTAHIGIDYSGAATATTRLAGLQVYVAKGSMPERVLPSEGRNRNWTRAEVAHWLITLASGDTRFIVGVDHGFSFPQSYFKRHQLASWDEFLEDFTIHWPTHLPGITVDEIRYGSGGRLRSGEANEYRLTETWTSSAKSVFLFDVQGSVAKSTHAGIPWLRELRRAAKQVHFWPFDGWQIPAGKSVIAEVYPSIFRRRYERETRSADQHDAYAIARWLHECDTADILPRYFEPPIVGEHRNQAEREGWILGIF